MDPRYGQNVFWTIAIHKILFQQTLDKLKLKDIARQLPVIIEFNDLDNKRRNISQTDYFKQNIERQILKLNNKTNNFDEESIEQFINLLQLPRVSSADYKRAWRLAPSWINSRQIIPKLTSTIKEDIGFLQNALQTARILKSDVFKKGTQLKVLLTLEGGQQAIFKPKRYSRDYITNGIYAGADRHNGEIIGSANYCFLNKIE